MQLPTVLPPCPICSKEVFDHQEAAIFFMLGYKSLIHASCSPKKISNEDDWWTAHVLTWRPKIGWREGKGRFINMDTIYDETIENLKIDKNGAV